MMASQSLDDLRPDTREVAEKLLAYARDSGISVRVTSTFRSCAEQDALYAQSRTAPGPRVTGAPGCRSWHTHGRAFDLLVKEADGSIVHNGHDPRYAQLGEYAKTLGMVWGGVFQDFGHFEYHPGLTISQACPDPSDCSHLGQPKSTPPPAPPDSGTPEPHQAAMGSGVAVIGLAVGFLTYLAVDMQFALTERFVRWLRTSF